MNKHVFGGLLITLSMIIFSLLGPFVRYVKLPPLVIIFHTSFFSFVLLLFYFIWTNKQKSLIIRNDVLWMIMSALFLLGNVYTYYKAYTATTMANTVLTHYTAPIFAALLAPALLREKLERITIISLVISMTGLFLIASNGLAISTPHFEGIAYGVLSGFFYGVAILISKKLTNRFHPFVILFYQCAIISIVIAPFLKTFQYTITPEYLLLLILYSVIINLLACFLYLKGLSYVEAQHAGILAYSEPVLVVLIGILFYNEIPTARILLGGLLIAYSGYLILKAEARRQ
jgi:drug/metabolite transporter (DMT)-like permease